MLTAESRLIIYKLMLKTFMEVYSSTFVRAQNDTSKTANITDTIFDRTLVTSDGVLKIGQIRRSVSC